MGAISNSGTFHRWANRPCIRVPAMQHVFLLVCPLFNCPGNQEACVLPLSLRLTSNRLSPSLGLSFPFWEVAGRYEPDGMDVPSALTFQGIPSFRSGHPSPWLVSSNGEIEGTLGWCRGSSLILALFV